MPRPAKILIVDDNPTNLVILEAMLGGDYQLLIATSGEEALAMASGFSPDLILLDIMMPGIDGYETCRRIRANPALRHTKIIMVSSKSRVAERLQGYEAGADDYVTKPFEREELLAKLQVYQRLKSIEEVDHLKSDVITLLSHETRTPLNTIIVPIELLMADDNLDPAERSELLCMVRQSAIRLQHLFDQVLTLSKMKSGAWDFELAQANLYDVVRSAISRVAPQAAERNVQILEELPDESTIQLDIEQIQEVFTTILENAIRFSPAGGRVRVGFRRGDDDVCVTVTDEGNGIDPDLRPYLFNVFAYTDLSAHSKGLGLSLSIAHQVVLAHSGTVEVESVQGSGTTFVVRLPVTTPTAGDRQPLCVRAG
jgi:signal transduction histidine kinase